MPPSPHPTAPRRRALHGPTSIATVVVALLGLSACGGSDDGDDRAGGVATIGTAAGSAPDGSTSDPTPATSGAPSDPEEAALAYDACMAEQGFPTDAASMMREADGGILVSGGSASISGDDSSDAPTMHVIGPGGIEIDDEDVDAFMAADRECQPLLANAIGGPLDLDPEQQAAMEDANLRVQQCLDEKGVGVHISIGTATAGSGSQIDVGDAPGSLPPPPTGEIDQDEVDAAIAECMRVFEEYPELEDVPVPGGAPAPAGTP